MYGRKYMGTARVTFIINEQGIIEEVIDKVDTKNHTDQILKGSVTPKASTTKKPLAKKTATKKPAAKKAKPGKPASKKGVRKSGSEKK